LQKFLNDALPSGAKYSDKGFKSLTGWLEGLGSSKTSCGGKGLGGLLEELSSSKPSSDCFITTAVCKTLQKPDDCAELTKFRHFRDTFMKSSEEMRSEIQEYYDIAPRICSRIDESGEFNSSQKYADIWADSLKPAFEALDMGDNQKAHDIYKEMVLGLKREYL
jgi:hypothetical protein